MLQAAEQPQSFIPERWLGIKKQYKDSSALPRLKAFKEELGFMPFAFVCPAGGEQAQAFGLKMIALLVYAIVEGLDSLPGEWKLEAGSDEDRLPSPGTTIKSGREDYLSLVFKKEEQQEQAVEGKEQTAIDD